MQSQLTPTFPLHSLPPSQPSLLFSLSNNFKCTSKHFSLQYQDPTSTTLPSSFLPITTQHSLLSALNKGITTFIKIQIIELSKRQQRDNWDLQTPKQIELTDDGGEQSPPIPEENHETPLDDQFNFDLEKNLTELFQDAFQNIKGICEEFEMKRGVEMDRNLEIERQKEEDMILEREKEEERRRILKQELRLKSKKYKYMMEKQQKQQATPEEPTPSHHEKEKKQTKKQGKKSKHLQTHKSHKKPYKQQKEQQMHEETEWQKYGEDPTGNWKCQQAVPGEPHDWKLVNPQNKGPTFGELFSQHLQFQQTMQNDSKNT